jgi:hypothetical protein
VKVGLDRWRKHGICICYVPVTLKGKSAIRINGFPNRLNLLLSLKWLEPLSQKKKIHSVFLQKQAGRLIIISFMEQTWMK